MLAPGHGQAFTAAGDPVDLRRSHHAHDRDTQAASATLLHPHEPDKARHVTSSRVGACGTKLHLAPLGRRPTIFASPADVRLWVRSPDPDRTDDKPAGVRKRPIKPS